MRVFQDPWIRRNRGFWARSQYDSSLSDIRVNALIQDGTRRWDEGLVETLFDEEEAKEILRTPLNSNIVQDKLIWHQKEVSIL